MAKHFLVRGALPVALFGAFATAGCGVESAGMAQHEPPNLGKVSPRVARDAGPKPEPESPPEPVEPPPVAVPEADAGCTLEGAYAVRIDANVRWEGNALFDIVPIIAKGNGVVSLDTLVTVAKQGDELVTTLRPCGASLPDLTAASVAETYGVGIPNETWDKISARWSSKARAACNEPGCALSTDFLTVQLGLTVPERSAWPSSRDPIADTSTRDDDLDGLPGIRMRAFGPREGRYKHPPTSYLLVSRVQEISIAARIGAELRGTMKSCDSLSGTAPSMILEMRALSCQLDSGALCEPAQLDFVDDHLPIWKIESAQWFATRVGTGASCAEVRELLDS